MREFHSFERMSMFYFLIIGVTLLVPCKSHIIFSSSKQLILSITINTRWINHRVWILKLLKYYCFMCEREWDTKNVSRHVELNERETEIWSEERQAAVNFSGMHKSTRIVSSWRKLALSFKMAIQFLEAITGFNAKATPPLLRERKSGNYSFPAWQHLRLMKWMHIMNILYIQSII